MRHPVRTTVLAYFGVILATTVGIVGMGILFVAISSGHLALAIAGLPLLMGGLYWSGRALGQSMEAHRARPSVRSKA